jgi:hypothetical protein
MAIPFFLRTPRGGWRSNAIERTSEVSQTDGLRVCLPNRPHWGLGHVLADDGEAKVTVFFSGAGRRTLDTTITELDLVTGEAAVSATLDIAGQVNWQHSHHNLYVVELEPRIFEKERRFSEANPHWLPGKLCVYVGMTGLTPEERLKKHLQGEKGARFVHKYSQRHLPDLYRHFNPLPHDLACVMEPELARQLREQGYGVWQN